MENQGRFDFAIIGDGLGALTTALLLSRQGERVIVIPEPLQRARENRLLFGYEHGGLIQGLLKRWGMTDDWLDAHVVDNPRIELVSDELTLSLRDPLAELSLGALRFELRGSAGERFLEALEGLEKNPAWSEHFHAELILAMQNAHRGWRRYLAPARNTGALWTRVLRRTLRAQVTGGVIRDLRLWEKDADRTTEEVRLLKQGTATLMGLGPVGNSTLGNRILDTLLEVYAVRRTPVARNRGDALIQQFKNFLKHQGVSFVEEQESVQLRRTGDGSWEGLFGNGRASAPAFAFEHLVIAHSLSERTLESFEKSARKTLESELRNEPFLYLEWSAKLPSHLLPFVDRTEVVYSDTAFPPVQLSIFGPEDGVGMDAGQSLLHVRTILADLSKLPTDPEQLRMRFERLIQDVFPLIDLSLARDVRLRMERHRDFAPHSGIRTKDPHIFHVNPASYPRLGEFGPFVAGMDLARKFARRRKRELRL